MKKKYAFWNNKGGTGKTSLIFQSTLSYAKKHDKESILVIDMCPQANFSELMLGGLVGKGSKELHSLHDQEPRKSVGGYFQMRLLQPYTPLTFDSKDYIISPYKYNENIPRNVDMLLGDPLLELQATGMTDLSNTKLPGQNTWIAIVDWLKDFLEPIKDDYDTVFIDCNPSFSIYTQIALSTADKLVIPVMADDSSRRALQNVFSLIYGLHLPSSIYKEYSFSTQLKGVDRTLPKVHLIVKNRLTQYMGSASAFATVLKIVDQQVQALMADNPDTFTFRNLEENTVDVRDFGTTGVIAFAKGIGFDDLSPGKHEIVGLERTQLTLTTIEQARGAIDNLVSKL